MSPDSTVLFESSDTVVTPSWLQLGNTSHAVRTIVRMDYHETAPPRTSLTLLGSLPPPLAWIILSTSLLLTLIIAWFAFVVPSQFRLDITLVDGNQLQVSRTSKSELEEIYQAVENPLD